MRKVCVECINLCVRSSRRLLDCSKRKKYAEFLLILIPPPHLSYHN